jgi:uncharacterized Zn finger protein (UPF0148 family)
MSKPMQKYRCPKCRDVVFGDDDDLACETCSVKLRPVVSIAAAAADDPNEKRYTVRADADDVKLIGKAAAKLGLSAAAFLRMSAIEKARKILGK